MLSTNGLAFITEWEGKKQWQSLPTLLAMETLLPSFSSEREGFSLRFRYLSACCSESLSPTMHLGDKNKTGNEHSLWPTRATFLCPLARIWWFHLDIFLFISALLFKMWVLLKSQPGSIGGTKKQEMHRLRSHSLSPDFLIHQIFNFSKLSERAVYILFRLFQCN